jgi:low temperature requirement protein LtrA
LTGGPALFLAGSAWFNRVMCGVWPRSHAVGLSLVAASAAAAGTMPPVLLSGIGTVILIGVGAWETQASQRRASGLAG